MALNHRTSCMGLDINAFMKASRKSRKSVELAAVREERSASGSKRELFIDTEFSSRRSIIGSPLSQPGSPTSPKKLDLRGKRKTSYSGARRGDATGFLGRAGVVHGKAERWSTRRSSMALGPPPDIATVKRAAHLVSPKHVKQAVTVALGGSTKPRARHKRSMSICPVAADSSKVTLFDDLRKFYNSSEAPQSPKIEEEGESGDEGLNEEESSTPVTFSSDRDLLMRESLKFSLRIRALLTAVWLAADSDGSNSLNKQEYLGLNKKLQIAVLGSYDEDEGLKLAIQDWQMDSQGQSSLNFSRFSLSWFQLADTWTTDVSEDAYCAFLGQLIQRMTCVNERGQLVFRADDDIVTEDEFYMRMATGTWVNTLLPENPAEVRQMYDKRSKSSTRRDPASTAMPNSPSHRSSIKVRRLNGSAASKALLQPIAKSAKPLHYSTASNAAAARQNAAGSTPAATLAGTQQATLKVSKGSLRGAPRSPAMATATTETPIATQHSSAGGALRPSQFVAMPTPAATSTGDRSSTTGTAEEETVSLVPHQANPLHLLARERQQDSNAQQHGSAVEPTTTQVSLSRNVPGHESADHVSGQEPTNDVLDGTTISQRTNTPSGSLACEGSDAVLTVRSRPGTATSCDAAFGESVRRRASSGEQQQLQQRPQTGDGSRRGGSRLATAIGVQRAGVKLHFPGQRTALMLRERQRSVAAARSKPIRNRPYTTSGGVSIQSRRRPHSANATNVALVHSRSAPALLHGDGAAISPLRRTQRRRRRVKRKESSRSRGPASLRRPHSAATTSPCFFERAPLIAAPRPRSVQPRPLGVQVGGVITVDTLLWLKSSKQPFG